MQSDNPSIPTQPETTDVPPKSKPTKTEDSVPEMVDITTVKTQLKHTTQPTISLPPFLSFFFFSPLKQTNQTNA